MVLIRQLSGRDFGGDKNVDAGGLFATITDSRERNLAFRPDTGTVA